MLNKTKLQTLINLLGITILILQNVNADIFLSKNGKPQYEIINDLQSSPPEKWAARELARVLSKIVGAEFQILQTANANSKKVIIVGRGSLAKKYFPEIDFDALGSEEVIIKTSGDRLLISGGRPRGTIYAVS
ncbi:MAG: alpha-glucuronidase family glycosyl hydrolase, partial [Limisphaerales bacterium]